MNPFVIKLLAALELLFWAAMGGVNIRSLIWSARADDSFGIVFSAGLAIICVAVVVDRYRKLGPVEKKETTQ